MSEQIEQATYTSTRLNITMHVEWNKASDTFTVKVPSNNVLIRTKVWNYNREDMQALVTLLQLKEVEE